MLSEIKEEFVRYIIEHLASYRGDCEVMENVFPLSKFFECTGITEQRFSKLVPSLSEIASVRRFSNIDGFGYLHLLTLDSYQVY